MLQIGILGLGLIGGSIAKALNCSSIEVVLGGFDVNPENAKFALENKIINYLIQDITEETMDLDIVIVAVPVSELRNIFIKLNEIEKKIVITDVCSVKEPVIRIAKELLSDKIAYFVPGHPISGMELSGPQNSTSNLFKNSTVILTPANDTRKDAVEQVLRIWKSIGATPVVVDPLSHDRLLAATSHVPHVLAYIAMHAIETLKPAALDKFTGGSFRDLTRVAESSPALWAEIFFNNKKNLTEMCQLFIDNINTIISMLENDDKAGMSSFLKNAQKAKIQLNDPENNCE